MFKVERLLGGSGGLGDSGTENGNCTSIIEGLGAGDLVGRLTMEPYSTASRGQTQTYQSP